MRRRKVSKLFLLVFALGVGFASTAAMAREGCGAGFHADRYGACVPNRGGAVVAAPGVAVGTPGVAVGVRPGVVVGAPGRVLVGRCPIHYHVGPGGHCRHN